MSGSEVRIEDGAPVKPGLPILLIGALVLWAACACAYGNAAHIETAQLTRVLPWCIGLSAALLILCAVRRVRIVAALAACVALGVSFGLYGAASVQMAAASAIGCAGEWRLTLASDASPGAFGSSATADATGPDGRRAWLSVTFDGDEPLLRGAVLTASLTPRAVKQSAAEYSWSQGIGAAASVSGYELAERTGPLAWAQGLRANAIGAFAECGGDQAGLLQALACGYRPTIAESGAYESYKACGLAHLVAVSGAHLAIVVALFRWLLGRLRMPALAANLCIIAFIAAYLVFAGIPISAVRASFMVILALGAGAAKRRSASSNALALCIIAFIALDPVVSVSVSLILSAASTLGILLFAGLIASWFRGAPRIVQGAIAVPLSMTLASNIATLPYSAALFSQLPLIAPVANIVAAPLFTLACGASLLGAIIACAAPAAAQAAVSLAALAAAPLSIAVDALARVPYACIAVSLPVGPMLGASIVACAALWAAWPQPAPKHLAQVGCGAFAIAACALFLVPLTTADEIVMLDVGQGDAFLVRSQGRAVLIDTGNKDALLREGIGALGVARLDAVVISHADDDHCGSLASLAGYVGIGAVYVADPLLACMCDQCADLRDTVERAIGQQPCGMRVGDEMRVGRFTLRAIWPDAFTDEGGNADSLCLLAEADCDSDAVPDQRALFTGDAESEQLAQMVAAGRVGDIDVLKVGHHGSRASLTDELAAALDPEIALISCGANNRYGHPTDEVLACLADAEALYRTDQGGAVALRFAKEGIAPSR